MQTWVTADKTLLKHWKNKAWGALWHRGGSSPALYNLEVPGTSREGPGVEFRTVSTKG